MSKILKVRSVNDYGSYLGCPARHPLVCVIDYAEVSPIRHSLNNYGVYALFLRDDVGVELDYGCGRYDYNQGTLLCVAPGQVGGKEDNGERVSITGWALLFHPDLLRGTPLEKRIRDYSFFDYRVNEALHMSDREHDILVSLMRRMREELDNERDAQQDAILVGYIGLVLNFCQRFYNRQFQSREAENSDILVRFNRLLADYYEQQLQLKLGLPTVQYCADRLCLSPNYFGDLVKRETGKTAQEYIQLKLVEAAKELMLAPGRSIGEVAYALGFQYPQHFTRLFKKVTGQTPNEYRSQQS